MLDVRLFRNPRFTAASGSIATGFFVLTGFTFLITQYFQFIKGYTPFSTGLRILPVAISIAVAAILGTRVAVAIGNKAVVASGLALFGAALFWIATNGASTPYIAIVGQMIVGGTGLGLITAPSTEAIMGVIGSVAASLYARRLGTTIPQGLPAQVVTTARGSVGGALVAAQHLPSSVEHALIGSSFGAFLHSFSWSLRVAGGVALAGAMMAAALLPARPGVTVPGADDDEEEAEVIRLPGVEEALG